MSEALLAFGAAFWLGVLTSISPCALATNIAAVSFLGRTVQTPGRSFIGGLLYVIGRTLAYTVLAMLLVKGLTAAPALSAFLEGSMNRFLGPLLILVGMILLNLISLGAAGTVPEALKERFDKGGLIVALPMGLVFALSFCPTSAAIFFGSLVPLAVKSKSAIAVPALFGVGTGLPVLVFAVLLALGARHVATAFNKVTVFEKWARAITGLLFIGVGVYYCLVYIFGVID